MPYSAKQNALFRAAAHSKAISKSSGIPMATAKRMAAEGIKTVMGTPSAAIKKTMQKTTKKK